MLHMINKSPFASDSLTTCLRFVVEGDPILLIEDAVYAVKTDTRFAELLTEAAGKNPIYALSGDLKARGVTNTIKDVTIVDYEGFVGLVEDHQVQSWL